MIYWMKSADGGRMPVYDRGEVARLEGFGWTLTNFGDAPTMNANIPPPVTVTVEQPPQESTIVERKKPGRPRKAE